MNQKKALSLSLAALLTLSPATALADEGQGTPWYAEAQSYVQEQGIMTGTDKGFEPEGTVTYATVLQTLYNLEGKPGTTEAEIWYADALAWWNTFAGTNVTLAEDFVTVRGAVKDIMDVYCAHKNLDSASLMKGNEHGDMMLDKELTRAEFAQILMNLGQLTTGPEAPSVTATVTEIEKYGHAVLDVTIADFQARGYALGDIVTVTVYPEGSEEASYTADMPYLDGYYVDNGEAMLRAYPGHTNIAVCINYGKFNVEASAAAGSRVVITMAERQGAAALQATYSLRYTNDRADYGSDEIFANFRPVVMGDIAEGRLYRSASPINNENGRAATADDLIKTSGIQTVFNLADTDEELAEYMAAEDFDSPY